MLTTKRILIIGLCIYVVSIGLPSLSFAEGEIVGCQIVYETLYDPYGIATSGKNMCYEPDADCITYEMPLYGVDCYVRICFGSQHTVVRYPTLRGTDDPSVVDVQCGSSISLPWYIKATGANAWWNECYRRWCEDNPAMDDDVEDLTAVQDWVNGDFIVSCRQTLQCDC